MFASIFITALAAAASVSGIALPFVPRDNAPASYAKGYLEDYNVYHTRYLALSCKTKHNTKFFDECCHPLLATETLAKNRPAHCNPNAKPSSTKAAAPAATSTMPDEEEECTEGEEDCVCEGDEEQMPIVEPKTSTHKATPTSTKPAATKPAATPKATPKASSGSSEAKTGGFATYFYQYGNPGACGNRNSDDALIAAIDYRLYGNTGVKSQYCGRQIEITNTNNNKKVVVTVADACPSCVNANSIDLSHGAFNKIATDAEGQVPISWKWV